MKKFLFSVLFVILLVATLPIPSLSADLPKNTGESVTTSTVANPYSAAMANYIADFVVKNGKKSIVFRRDKDNPQIDQYKFKIRNLKKLYSLTVLKNKNQNIVTLNIIYYFVGIVPLPITCMADHGPSGKFSIFVDSENFFVTDKKVVNKMKRKFSEMSLPPLEKIVEIQKKYDSFLYEIVACIRSLEMNRK